MPNVRREPISKSCEITQADNLNRRRRLSSVTGAPYREVNSKVATAPKLKVEDKDRVK